MKFKVGDRVKHKQFGEGNIVHYDENGEQPYLVEFDKSNPKLHSGSLSKKKYKEKHCWWCYEHEMQLIKPVQFTKSDLKDGDIVTYRNGEKRIKLANKLFDRNGSLTMWLHSYNEDLTREYRERKETDIIKVERHPEELETVFEREEILDKAEKEYLSGVIRPWRDEVRGIIKEKLNDKNWISIDFKNDACMDFPNLDKKEDYKNMEAGKMYTLEELGL